MESLSLIDAVMPDVVASRQNQVNQQKIQNPSQIIKNEPQETNGEEGNQGLESFNFYFSIFDCLFKTLEEFIAFNL